jgi:hypothetical protein
MAGLAMQSVALSETDKRAIAKRHWWHRLSDRCGICGSSAIKYRDIYSGEAVCGACVETYVHDWYVAEKMLPACEALT